MQRITEGQTDGRTERRTHGRTDRQTHADQGDQKSLHEPSAKVYLTFETKYRSIMCHKTVRAITLYDKSSH